jgi:hypothetical protein
MRKLFYILFSIAALVAAMSFIAPKQPSLTINFENYVGNQLLKLDSVTYKNEMGQSFTVSKFKYYISNITLTNWEGFSYKIDSSFLVNEEEPLSKKITIDRIPSLEYSTITFTIGVDSIHNCSGAQSGALDPVNAMFWAWNTGYIFVKMEGKSPVSKSPGNLLEFHIGGYRTPYNCIRTVTLKLPQQLNITKNRTEALTIKTNLAELFKTPTTIDFSKLSSVTDFHNATTIADNYTDMFSIK